METKKANGELEIGRGECGQGTCFHIPIPFLTFLHFLLPPPQSSIRRVADVRARLSQVVQRPRPATYVRGGAQYLRQILLRSGDGFGDLAAARKQGRNRRRERTARAAYVDRRDLRRSKNVEFVSVEKDVSGFVFQVPAFD